MWTPIAGLADLVPEADEVRQARDLLARVPPRWEDEAAKLAEDLMENHWSAQTYDQL